MYYVQITVIASIPQGYEEAKKRLQVAEEDRKKLVSF